MISFAIASSFPIPLPAAVSSSRGRRLDPAGIDLLPDAAGPWPALRPIVPSIVARRRSLFADGGTGRPVGGKGAGEGRGVTLHVVSDASGGPASHGISGGASCHG